MATSPIPVQGTPYENMPIEDLRLSMRPRRHLKKAGILTVGDLLQLTTDEILRIPSIGRTSLNEILYRVEALLGVPLEELHQRCRLGLTEAPDFQQPVGVLSLPPRARNALRSLGVEKVADAMSLSESTLLELPGVGRGTVRAIRRACRRYARLGERTGQRREEKAAARKGRSGENAQDAWLGDADLMLVSNQTDVSSLDLPVRARSALEFLSITTVAELVATPPSRLLRLQNLGEVSILAVREALRRHIRVLKGPAQLTWERTKLKELAERLLGHLLPRHRDIVMERSGLWDGIGETLQDIGDKRGVSRERIRQILADAKRKLREALETGPAFRTAQAAIFSEVLLPALAEGSGLITSDRARDLIGGLSSAAPSEQEHIAYDFFRELNDGKAPLLADHMVPAGDGVYAVSRSTADLYGAVVSCTKSVLGRAGAPQLVKALARKVARKAFPLRAADFAAFVLDCVELTPGLVKDDSGLVGLPSWDFFPADTLAQKLVTALVRERRPMHYTQLSRLLNELFASEGPFEPHNVHARLCTNRKRFKLVQRGVYGLQKWGLRRAPTIKERLTQVLEESRRPLDLETLQGHVLATCRCKESSVKTILDMSKGDFTEVDKGVYGLARWYKREGPT